MQQFNKAYLSLGSNIGDKKGYIDTTIDSLEAYDQTKVMHVSSYYKTEPIGYTDQDWFLNVVVQIETALTPHALLNCGHTLERQFDRKRSIRWGPRTIDIDILLYENWTVDDDRLTLPHPRMHERAFVIIPLQEIAPEIRIHNQDIRVIAARLSQQKVVRCTSRSMAN